ncbi:MAG: elongation factor Ts [Chloroflexi bacterium]|nr:elongation factor Ts [Chloroflexota bacterium]
MQVSAEAIKILREQTNAGIMDCKRALQETKGDIAAAAGILRQKGHALAKKKEARVASQGLIEAYVHTGSKVGALVEVNCESDFVARTPEFKSLAHDIAMQVVGACPRYVNRNDVPEGTEAADEDILLLQPFIKDPSKKVQDLITESVSRVRENIQVRRFVRFELGLDGKDA